MISVPNSLSAQTANLLGVNFVRDGSTLSNHTYTKISDLRQAGFFVNVVVNAFGQSGTRGWLQPSELPQYRTDLDELIAYMSQYGTASDYLLTCENEEANTGYRILDTVNSANLYLNMLAIFVEKMHAVGYKVSTGGFTGNAMKWLVYKDLKDQGRTADAQLFKISEFTPADTLGQFENWNTVGPFKTAIAITKQLIAGYKSSAVDYVNIHWKAPTNGTTPASIDVRPMQWTFEYYSRATGKPGITNELGTKNNSATIPVQMLKQLAKMNVPYVVYYDGGVSTATSGTDDNTIRNLSDNTLAPQGTALKQANDTLKTAPKDILKTQNGTVLLTGIAPSTPLPLVIMPDGSLVPGSASSAGTSLDTAALNKAIAGKQDTTAGIAYTRRIATKDSIITRFKDSSFTIAPLGLGDVVWDNMKKKYTGTVNAEYKLTAPRVSYDTIALIPRMLSNSSPSPYIAHSNTIGNAAYLAFDRGLCYNMEQYKCISNQSIIKDRIWYTKNSHLTIYKQG